MIFANGQQARIFALAARIGHQGQRVIAGDFAQPFFQIFKQLLIALGLFQRGKRVQMREMPPGDGDHLRRRIQFHGAGPQRDHRPIQRDVLRRQPADVSQHFRFAMIHVENGMSHKTVWHAAHRMGDDVVARILVQGGDIEQAVGLGGKHPQQVLDIGLLGDFIDGNPDCICIDKAQIDAGFLRLCQNARGLAWNAHLDRVKELIMHDFMVHAPQPFGHDLGLAVNAARDAIQAIGTVIDAKESGDHGQQDLCRADIAGRLFAPDMLFTGLQRHAQGFLAFGIHRHADDAPGALAFIDIFGRKEGRMRAAIAHGNTKSLGGTHHDIGPELARGFQHHHGHQIAGDNRQAALGLNLFDRLGDVAHLSRRSWILHQYAKHIGRFQIGEGVPLHNCHAHRLRAGLQDGQSLGVHVVIDKEGIGFRLTHTMGHRHGFGCCRSFIQQGRIGDFHAGQVDDHLLVIQQCLQAALADFRLIGGIGRVPAWIFQNIPQDDRWRDGAVIAHADHGGEHLVPL